MKMKLWACFLTLLFVLASLVPQGWGQGQGQGQGQGEDSSTSLCLNQLAPCLNYLNGTRDVPDSCCDPLKSVIKSKPECLCSMISNEGSREAEQAGINISEAQQLPGRCGQHVNPLVCLSGSPNSKNSAEDSAGVLLFPPHSAIIIAVAICMTVENLWVYPTPH
ncbi:hypothetical protein QUC31_017887 [Theobroma cacao]|uniref:Lipid transfer-like protein VAS n=1 Tax=Theobroma cacao TaxID=3641 RepID=A0AB32V8X0_THECC|nr:PREDICTED: lipid transfer-like protein VAS [Theobroma cacao]